MICTDEIVSFDCNFDEDKLLLYYDQFIQKAESYSDYRGKLDNWKIARDIRFDYAEELCERFNVNGSPRFYSLVKNTTLPMHVDHGTECSLNFLIDESEPAPVRFESGNEYRYKFCLLNTQKKHGVDNVSEDRILFKLSIFDETFEQVKQKILYTYLNEKYGSQKKYKISEFKKPIHKNPIQAADYENPLEDLNKYQEVVYNYIGTADYDSNVTYKTLERLRSEPDFDTWRFHAMSQTAKDEYEKLPEVIHIYRAGHPDYSSSISWSLDPHIYKLKGHEEKKNPFQVFNIATTRKSNLFYMSDRSPMFEVLVLPENVDLDQRMKLPWTEYDYDFDHESSNI